MEIELDRICGYVLRDGLGKMSRINLMHLQRENVVDVLHTDCFTFSLVATPLLMPFPHYENPVVYEKKITPKGVVSSGRP